MHAVILSFFVVLGALDSLAAQPQIIVNRPTTSPRGLVVIAPAKKYLMQERLFTQLAAQLAKKGLIVVRFNWRAETLSDPALELKRAAEDLYLVTTQAQRNFGASPKTTVLITKSFSTKALAPSLGLARSHVLLTPNCAPEAPFADTYEAVLKRRDLRRHIVISNEDPNCDVRQIHQTLARVALAPTLTTTHGDHNFTLEVANRQVHSAKQYLYQDQVVELVSIQVLTDLFTER